MKAAHKAARGNKAAVDRLDDATYPQPAIKKSTQPNG